MRHSHGGLNSEQPYHSGISSLPRLRGGGAGSPKPFLQQESKALQLPDAGDVFRAPAVHNLALRGCGATKLAACSTARFQIERLRGRSCRTSCMTGRGRFASPEADKTRRPAEAGLRPATRSDWGDWRQAITASDSPVNDRSHGTAFSGRCDGSSWSATPPTSHRSCETAFSGLRVCGRGGAGGCQRLRVGHPGTGAGQCSHGWQERCPILKIFT